jgi:hypothetical protein
MGDQATACRVHLVYHPRSGRSSRSVKQIVVMPSGLLKSGEQSFPILRSSALDRVSRIAYSLTTRITPSLSHRAADESNRKTLPSFTHLSEVVSVQAWKCPRSAALVILVTSVPPLQTNRFLRSPSADLPYSRVGPASHSIDFSDDLLDVRISAYAHDLNASYRGLRRKLRMEFQTWTWRPGRQNAPSKSRSRSEGITLTFARRFRPRHGATETPGENPLRPPPPPRRPADQTPG